MAERVRAVVHGDVQGVGFRDFVQRRASSLGLNGLVRNRSDGAVEVVAEGAAPAIEGLLDSLRQGPRMARVDRVDEERGPAAGDLQGFRVAY